MRNIIVIASSIALVAIAGLLPYLDKGIERSVDISTRAYALASLLTF